MRPPTVAAPGSVPAVTERSEGAVRVEVDRERGVARVTLVRPTKLNALDEAVRTGLARTVGLLAEADDVRVVVLAGQGRAFSAGADLAERVPAPPDPLARRRRRAGRPAGGPAGRAPGHDRRRAPGPRAGHVRARGGVGRRRHPRVGAARSVGVGLARQLILVRLQHPLGALSRHESVMSSASSSPSIAGRLTSTVG